MAKKRQSKPDYEKLQSMAYQYVVQQGKTQKEASEILGVSEQSMSDWAREGGWRALRKMRQSAVSTARQNIQSIISLISDKRLKIEYQINDAIDAGDKDRELRLRKEANQLSADITWQRKNLEGVDKENKITLGIYVDVFDSIFSDLRAYNADFFDQTIQFQTLHLRKKSNELG